MSDQTQTHEAPGGVDPTEYALGDSPRTGNHHRRDSRAARRQEAFEMRRDGHSFEVIGQKLGVSPNTVSVWVREAIALIPTEEADELRRVELDRLDAMLVPQFKQALKGDGWAVDRVLKIMERRSRYLNLDAATTAGIREVGSLLDMLVHGSTDDATA